MPNTVTFEWTVAGHVQLRRTFAELDRRFDDLRPAFGDMMDVVEDETRHQFHTQGDPPWADLSEAYEAGKMLAYGHATKLVVTGALALSLIERWAPGAIVRISKLEMRRGTSLTVGKKRKWNLGLIHQLGAPNVKRGDGTSLPARPMMVLRDDAQQKLTDILADYLWEEGSATYSEMPSP